MTFPKLPLPKIILCILVLQYHACADPLGTWELLVADAGIASMHTAVTRFNTVVLLDRTNIGASGMMLGNGKCRNSPYDDVLKNDCYAHSALLDLQTNQVRPLMIQTDTWCSSGGFLPDGTLLQTGGDFDGINKIRKFEPCPTNGQCDWVELDNPQLARGRWYATNQILPDGSMIIVGGRWDTTVEYFPPRNGAIHMQFLSDTNDGQMDNLYPYVHLLPDDHLFIFANTKAVLYDHYTNTIVKDYPPLNGGPRNYPSAGSSAMLALQGDYSTAVIVVCGGAEYGAYDRKLVGAPAHGTCGRIVATAPDPVWEMEDMPFGRIMGDMITLPNGNVLIINGAASGSQGFGYASNPRLNPVLYNPYEPPGSRFTTMNPATVPRMYHSTANLLPDGRVLVAGSNTHYYYTYDGDFPTEKRIEAFSPDYLSPERINARPKIEGMPEMLQYGQGFEVLISMTAPAEGVMEVNLASAPFATHSFSMGQRLVKLNVEPVVADGTGRYRIRCTAPPNGVVAPPGYYMAFVVYQGVPSVARWIHVAA